jgi:hypothetical protein
MRLLDVQTLEFEEFHDDATRPKYVIASHRWGSDEAKFKDVLKQRNRGSDGFQKIKAFARYVRDHISGVRWLWIDTCCINKDSAAELSEAINSMFQWYRDAELCIAYLPNVEAAEDVAAFKHDEWFRRGWTLQELLAPRLVVFVTKNWQVIGNKGSSHHDCSGVSVGPDLAVDIAEITKIPRQVLDDWARSVNFRNAEKMRWMEGRKTTKEEDMSYALFGILGVSLSVIYGEGEERARNRVIAELRYRDEVDEGHGHKSRRDEQTQEEHTTKWQDIVMWLAPPDPWVNHESARKIHERGTGNWLLETNEYRTWKDGTIRCIWLHGGAGCGKTILCSTAIQDMREYCTKRSNLGHGAFYFSFSDKRKQSYEDLLTSLVVQFGCQEPGFKMLRNFYDSKDRRKPGRDEQEKIILASLTAYDLVFLHLDALDECPEEHGVRRRVLQGMREFLRQAPSLQILVTSRGEADIRQWMAQQPRTASISVANDVTGEDMRRYIKTQMTHSSRLCRLDYATRTLVEETLLRKADGMYVCIS